MSCPPSSNRKAHSPFPRFMELALYHGEHGYYSNPAPTRIGHTGDFATSVSGGQAFGRLLAIRLHDLSPEERNRDFLRQF